MTGGIIALGLGLGIPAAEIVRLYEEQGCRIFEPPGPARAARRRWRTSGRLPGLCSLTDVLAGKVAHVHGPKHSSDALRAALTERFGSRLLGESETRLVVPSFNAQIGQVYLFKTSHHPRFERDHKASAVDVALATAAAPTYFPAHTIQVGSTLVDGGIWANNPAGLAVVEGVAVLGWKPEEIRLFSLGCTDQPLAVPKRLSAWWLHLPHVIEVMFRGQAEGSIGTAKLLLNHTELSPRMFRRTHVVNRATFALDAADQAGQLAGLGKEDARQFVPTYRKVFLVGDREPFVDRMRVEFDARRRALAEAAGLSAEDIPDYRVKTPLQQAVQILKRHRDVTFSGRIDDRPISVILTTLAARSYGGEDRIAAALFSIVRGMDSHVEDRDGVSWVLNPTDPRENFADRWEEYPARRNAFYDWLAQAREDFGNAASKADIGPASEALVPGLGRRLVEAAVARRAGRPRQAATAPGALLRAGSQALAAVRSIVAAPYRKQPVWPERPDGAVRIDLAVSQLRGHRPRRFASGSAPLAKNASLTFQARTTVRRPFHVYWQVTNTGGQAVAAKAGRGGFEQGEVTRGALTRSESTLYAGSHGIECFIVKEGVLVARSGVFVVNIA